MLKVKGIVTTQNECAKGEEKLVHLVLLPTDSDLGLRSESRLTKHDKTFKIKLKPLVVSSCTPPFIYFFFFWKCVLHQRAVVFCTAAIH